MIKCRRCLFKTQLSGNIVCGYCLFTGHMRECEADDCDKFEKMDKKKRKQLERTINNVCAPKADDEYKHYISEIMTKGRET